MKILQIGSTDLIGRRFNGHDLNLALNNLNIHSNHCVWYKESNDVNTFEITSNRILKKINKGISKIESLISLQSILYPSVISLVNDKRFKEADIIHFHLIHDYFFSLLSIPLIAKHKKVVWTLHDPWAITGHCVHPIDCEKFLVGCKKCPHLNRPFPMRLDNASLMWNLKNLIYQNSNLNLIVASEWMLNLIKKSPLLGQKKINLIKFGINLNNYDLISEADAKSFFKIEKDSIVLFFRATKNEFKGLNYVYQSLKYLETKKKITLLTVDEKGLLDDFKDKFNVIELGLVNDDNIMTKAFKACDIFLMPSIAESFGLMAIEAMASGKLVLSLTGTALSETIFAPKGGIAAINFNEFFNYLKFFIENPEKRNSVGKMAKFLSEQNYNFDSHVNSIIDLYKRL